MGTRRKRTAGCRCCVARPCTVTFVCDCDGTPVAGASVSVSGAGGASGTTGADGSVTLTIGGPGDYPVSASAAGDPGFSGTLHLACGGTYALPLCPPPCLACAVVSARCPSDPVAGIAVSFAGTLGAAAGTTDATGRCCVTMHAGEPGPIVVTPAAGACGVAPASATIACGGTASFATACPSTGAEKICVTGCGGRPVPAATVVVTGPMPGGPSWSQAVDSSGCVYFPIPAAGSYDYAVDPGDPRLRPASGSFAAGDACATGGTIAVALSPEDGWSCACCDGPWPVPDVLYLSDSTGHAAAASSAAGGYRWSWCFDGVPSSHCYTAERGCHCDGGTPELVAGFADGSTGVALYLSCHDNGDGTVTWTMHQQVEMGGDLMPKSMADGGDCPDPSAPCDPTSCVVWIVPLACSQLAGWVSGSGWDAATTTDAACESLALTFNFPSGTWATDAAGGCAGNTGVPPIQTVTVTP